MSSFAPPPSNRVRRNINGTIETLYTYDRENRLVETDGGTENKINVYSKGDTRNDYLGAVTYYTDDTSIYRYSYDYRTRRVLKDATGEGGEASKVSFSGGTSVQEWGETNTGSGLFDELQVEYIRGSDYGGGIGGLLYSLRSGTPSFKHYNSRGDVVAATDASGSLTYQAAYEAFGKHGDTPTSEEWGNNPDPQQANTKEEDPTGLLNEGFRYRDLETGTFITRDPLGFVDGPKVYTYVVQNPWTFFDPLGLKVEFDDDTGYEEYRQQIAENEDQSSIRSEIVRSLESSDRVFEFEGIEDYKMHVSAREQVVANFSELDANFGVPNELDPSLFDSDYKPKDGVSISDALNSFFGEGPPKNTIACVQACIVTMDKAALDVLGVDEFTNNQSRRTTMDRFASIDDWIPGDWGYVRNPSIDQSNPSAMTPVQLAQAGENIIYMGGERFSGFTGSVQTQPLTGSGSWVEGVSNFSTNRPSGRRATVYSHRTYSSIGLK